MNATNDLDRLLGEWLDEGPRRAPDRPLEIALEHARSHPRRLDPIGFLRPDPMAPVRRGMGLRPVLVLAGLTLVIAAAVVVGGGALRNDGTVVPPLVSPSPSPSPSATPSGLPTDPATAGILVDLEVAAGEPQTVDVVDESGFLVSAASGTPGDGVSFPSDAVVVSQVDDRTIQLGWSGYPCRTDHRLSIGAGEGDPTAMVLERPACEGETDAIALDRILVLTFSEPIDAGDVEVEFQDEAPSGTAGL